MYVLMNSAIGTACGAATVLTIQYLIERYKKKTMDFKNLLSLQLSLNQMLNIVLQLQYHLIKSETEQLSFYRENIKNIDPQKVWDRFRMIDLPGLYQTIQPTCFDWDYTQFLSKKESDGRQVLASLFPARFSYQQLNEVLNERNELLIKSDNMLDKEAALRMYQNDNLKKIIGNSLFEKLNSITTYYVDSILPSAKAVHMAFDKVGSYIERKYPKWKSYTLNLPPHLKQELEKIR